MSAENFIPELWHDEIQKERETNLVIRHICDTAYEGEIKKKGDTIHFAGIKTPTIKDYVKGQDIEFEDIKDDMGTLLIDQAKYFAVTLDNIDKAQSDSKLLNEQSRQGAYALNKTADSFVLGKYAEAANTITNNGVTVANALYVISEVKRTLEEKDIMKENGFVVVTPWFKELLTLAGIHFQIKDGITKGISFTDELDIDMYVSNQLAESTGHTAAQPAHHMLAGSYKSIIYGDNLVDIQGGTREKRFEDYIKGLHVYGAKVIRPKELIDIQVQKAANALA